MNVLLAALLGFFLTYALHDAVIFDGPRNSVTRKLMNRVVAARLVGDDASASQFILDLMSCRFCISFYTTGAATGAWTLAGAFEFEPELLLYWPSAWTITAVGCMLLDITDKLESKKS